MYLYPVYGNPPKTAQELRTTWYTVEALYTSHVQQHDDHRNLSPRGDVVLHRRGTGTPARTLCPGDPRNDRQTNRKYRRPKKQNNLFYYF